ncbi:ABC transporter ATP-binding protein [Rhizobium sp. BK376]|uniref:ABC transporter ATP-binding protein n=1 Tax=Rhizobium sp. BK376 TaxID=2512149 RepID=UPI00104E41FA|nr:ABC transporter ATP-binding protein [Rhizobium sp. BK376]TCR75590.1 branched-chain amino acid transport system ATP-binding protein [Rhizobium sp. BK376]
MLEVEHLSAWYGRTQALFDVSFSLQTGRCMALVGTNGAGKTTTVRSVLGLIRTAGSIRIEGEASERLATPKRVRRHRIAVVHEGRGLLKQLSVFENIVVGLPKSAYGRLDEALDLFPALKSRLSEPVTLLSGGQQQMVALARAVAERPKLLLLDEPSLGLAPGIVDEIYGHLGKLRAAGLTMLLVEQNIARARDFADELCLVQTGRSAFTVPATDTEAVTGLMKLAFNQDQPVRPPLA